MSKNLQARDRQSCRERLSEQQLAVLRSATPHEGRLLIAPMESAGPLVRRSVAALIKRALLAQTPAKPNEPHWGRNERGRVLAVRLTPKGLAALSGAPAVTAQRQASDVIGPADVAGPTAGPVGANVGPLALLSKPGTKRAMVIGLLERREGASLYELVAATGWLPHTTRAALTGLRRQGFAMDKSQRSDGKTCYRIAAPESHAVQAI